MAFNDALHLVPTWNKAHQLNIDYLINDLMGPIAHHKAILTSTQPNGTNCCVGESNLPLRNLLCIDATVMLLKNFVVEHKLMNGSVGVIHEQWFKNENRDAHSHDLDYYIVEFPDCTMTSPLIPGKLVTGFQYLM